jgi:hypothetical protein
VAHVGNHANDGDPGIRRIAFGKPKTTAEGLRVRPETASQTLADDGYRWRIHSVPRVKGAALQQRQSQRTKVIVGDRFLHHRG